MSSSVQSGTPITNDLFSQALQHALQASGQPSLQVSVAGSSFHSPRRKGLYCIECCRVEWFFLLPPEAEQKGASLKKCFLQEG